MRGLNASDLLNAWERGSNCRPVDRALLLLCAAGPARAEELARLPPGRRDARLLRLREQVFGPRLACMASCPACGAALEWDFTAADLGVNGAPDPAEALAFTDGAWEVQFRLPDSRDLAALAPEADLETNRQRLLRACLLEVRHAGRQIPADDLPADFAAALVERMAESDPLADVRLSLHCPDCAHEWEAGFDVVSFFWAELNAWATQLLREVHELASACGWSEAEILALSPQRRQAYLNMVRA